MLVSACPDIAKRVSGAGVPAPDIEKSLARQVGMLDRLTTSVFIQVLGSSIALLQTWVFDTTNPSRTSWP